MRIKVSVILTLLLVISTMMHAQVTIGSNITPDIGVVLDLKQNQEGISTLGMNLPRVELQLPDELKIGDQDYSANKEEHTGLIVYNVTTREDEKRLCPGVHVWDGTQWIPLIAYPVWEKKIKLVRAKLNSFTFLNPDDPTGWPSDRTPSNYKLGHIGTFADVRKGDSPQTYNYTRYYVGLANRTRTYKLLTSYSCDANNPVYVEGEEYSEPPFDVFEDGVWMAENLRATKYDIKRDVNGEILQNLLGPDYNTIGSSASIAWGYADVSEDNKGYGLFYTWAAATNGKGGAGGEEFAEEEKGLNEGLQIQGICPSGWHLPSDRQWTDLENAMIQNTRSFSSLENIGGNNLAYEAVGWRGTKHGTAMKSTTPIGYMNSLGASSGKAVGGFDALLIGRASKGSGLVFGREAYFWSSSSSAEEKGVSWSRNFNYLQARASRTNGNYRMNLFSVRCKKNTN